MKYIVTLNGKEYEVEVEQGTAQAVYLGEAAAPATTPVAAAPAAADPVAAAPAAPVAQGEGEVVASPMPGAIVAVNVQQGAQVKAGQVLFILEAMKMENEISAPKDGTITSVCITKGSTVDTGAALCTIA